MPRVAQLTACKYCKLDGLKWAKVPNKYGKLSVRLVNPETNEVHSCRSFVPRRRGWRQPLETVQPHAPLVPNAASMTPEEFSSAAGKAVMSAYPQYLTEPEPTETAVEKVVRDAKATGNRALYELIAPFVQSDIAESLEGFKPATTTGHSIVHHHVTITKPDTSTVVVKGAHKLFARLLKRVSLKQNVLLVGPAGSGKTHAAHMVAQALDLPYYPLSVGPQTSKSDLIGYMDATGKLVRTVLREAYEHGGVFLLDEVDAGNPGVLTVLNAMLANSVCSFPDGVIAKHENFRCIAAGNTYGQGANRVYTGRQQLDGATVDRFVGLDWEYDTDLEAQLSESQPDWCLFVWALRKAADKLGIRRIFGTRRILQGVALLDGGISLADVQNETVWFGCSTDDKAKLEANV